MPHPTWLDRVLTVQGLYSIAMGQHTRSNDVGCDMPYSPFDITHQGTKSGVSCNHHPWKAHTVS